VLGGRDDEQRVGKRGAASGPARGLGHAGRVGVDADHERVGSGGGPRKHVSAVAGPQVERDPGVTRGELVDLADVDFAEGASFDHAQHELKSTPQIQPRCLKVRYRERLVLAISTSASG
jgi:hypothetical protein